MMDILSFHLPRYEELPDLEIYMDQVLQLIQRYYEPFVINDEPILTKTMINNYVKHGIIAPPIKKKYNRDHLAYLVVITFLKNAYSMNEIATLIRFQMKSYPTAQSYNYFCTEAEACIQAVFQNQPPQHVPAHNDNDFEVSMLQMCILSVVNKLYVQLHLEQAEHYVKEKKS